VAANLRREMEQVVKEKVKMQVMDSLLTAHPIELPRALVEKERERLRQQAGQHSHGNQVPPADILEEPARKRVALGLILGELVKREGLKPDSQRVRAAVEGIASTYEDPEGVTRWIYSNRAQIAEIESMVMEDQVVDWVLAHAQVQEVPTHFKTLMNRQPAEGEGVST